MKGIPRVVLGFGLLSALGIEGHPQQGPGGPGLEPARVQAQAAAQSSAAQSALIAYLNTIGYAQLERRASAVASITTKEAAERRQAEVRHIIYDLVGGVPRATGPVTPSSEPRRSSRAASTSTRTAAVGIAGVVGYSVVQRTQEIGIRMALGAESKDVLTLVVGGSMAWALGGVGAGVLLSFGALRPLRSLLYGVGSTDPFVLAGVSLVLMAVAAAASYLPARRASRVDPVVALRAE